MVNAAAGGGRSIPSHEHETDTDSRVYVNDVRVPVGDIDIHVRKEGPTDLSRYAEGIFASPFEGVEYAKAFDGLSPDDQEQFDRLRIEIKDHVTGEYHLAFRGLVTGVGNASEGGEKIWRFRAQDPNLLLDKITASKFFRSPSGEDILNYVASRLDECLPFDVSVLSSGDSSFAQTINAPSVSYSSASPNHSSSSTEVQIATGRTFRGNKDYLSDVLNWYRDKTDSRIWLQPTENGLGIVATTDPTVRSHVAHYLDSEGHTVAVENNDAYVEIKPINTLIVAGAAHRSVGNDNPDAYIEVKARHRPLYERAGEYEYHGERKSLSDAQSSSEVKYEARSQLKEQIDEATGGDMQTLLAAPIAPYDTIEALPTCDENVAPDLEPITYEVSRVHHEINASGLSQTTLNVGVATEREDIEITKTWEREA
jgi:hypothetical protein